MFLVIYAYQYKNLPNFDFLTYLQFYYIYLINFRCWVDGVDTNETEADWNSTEVLMAIPLTTSGSLHSCLLYNDHNETELCSKWVYDKTYHPSSRAVEWSLVCSRRWMGALAQSVFMFGVFAGAITLGGLSDKLGRKKVFIWSAIAQLILGISVAFTADYWLFLVIRFFYGVFGAAGSYISAFVLTMEIVGTKWRTICGITFQIGFSMGIVLVGAWGAIIPNRFLLQVVYGLHGTLLIPHIWVMDESPRWLWAQGRLHETIAIIEKGLRFNKSKETLDKAAMISRGKVETVKRSENSKSATVLDLFKTPNLRWKTINVCVCWFANSLVYYGLSLSAGNLKGNPFLIIAILGLVEIPSYGAVAYYLDVVGRRLLVSSLMLLGGIASIYATFVTMGSTLSTVIVMLGKLFITGSFGALYNYSAELFPTVVRNSALGLGSMCARLSAMLTPMITLLDSFDPKIPAIVFGVISVVSGFLCLLLPETMNKPMPQSLEDGEKFGKGDTLFTTYFSRNRNKRRYIENESNLEAMVPLHDLNRKP